MNVAFLANSFHLSKTKSANFFIDLLQESFGNVAVIPNKDAWLEIPKKTWDLIVVWQHRYPPKELEAFGAKNIVLVPMYDDTPLDREFWEQYRAFKVFCFSSTIEKRLIAYGLSAWGSQYFPDSTLWPQVDWSHGLRAFFWPRTRKIDWKVVQRLIGDTAFEHIHIHWTPDVHGDVPSPISEAAKRSGSIEVSSWFRDAQDYRTALARSNVFFASRVAEGIGMSFLEAMAMGLCVVAPNAPTMNEYIQNGVNGLLYDPENPKPLDFSRAHELGKAARLSVQKGRDAWTASKKEIVSFLSEPAPGYVAKFHPLIIAKGRGISFARKIYRFLKQKLKDKKA